MQPLLQITTTPIEYEIKIEPSRLEYNQADNAKPDFKQRPAKLNMDSQNIRVRIDTMDMRRSLGFQNNSDRAQAGAQRGRDNVSEYIANQNQFGRNVSQIENGVKISDVVRQKMLEQPSSYTAFLPTTGPQVSWVPNSLNTDYQPGELSTEWQTMRNVFEYVPGKYHMNITQYPKVEIEYLGEPRYIPKSSDPNYQETE